MPFTFNFHIFSFREPKGIYFFPRISFYFVFLRHLFLLSICFLFFLLLHSRQIQIKNKRLEEKCLKRLHTVLSKVPPTNENPFQMIALPEKKDHDFHNSTRYSIPTNRIYILLWFVFAVCVRLAVCLCACVCVCILFLYYIFILHFGWKDLHQEWVFEIRKTFCYS